MSEATRHTCHAIGCEVVIPPRLYMCAKHWQIVPRPMRELVRATYRPDQEHDKRPSRAYLDAARQARDYVMSRHGGS